MYEKSGQVKAINRQKVVDLMSKKGYTLICIVVAAIMVISMVSWISASEAAACPEHPAHDETCGYVEEQEGHECAHQHNENCYVQEFTCADQEHTHTEECTASG